MRMTKTIVTMTAALAALAACARNSAPFLLDTFDGTRVAQEVETIAYSTAWDDGTAVSVAVDGVTLKEAFAPASGDVVWNAANAGAGSHTLTHTTYKNGVASKVETATFQVEKGNPDPVNPDPVNPDPVNPDPVNPDPDPDPVNPDPVNPDPVNPDPVTPDPVNPDPVNPDPVNPDPVNPDPVTPDPVNPDPVNPDPVTPDPVTPDPVTPDPTTPGYEVIEATDIVAPYEAPKAVTLQGVVYDGGKVVGIVELKLGKVNAKKKTSKVSGSVTTLDGKKHKITAFNVTEIDGTTPKAVSLEVKDFGAMAITIGGEQFAGAMGKYHVQSAVVGGNATGTGTKVYVDAGGASGGRALPEGTLEELLPDGEPVVASGGKWKFAKAASVKWAKPKKGAALPERYDEASGKGLIVDDTKGKTNLSAMKLTYTPKKGTFKGSFKVYALEGAGKATKLKKYTVKVSGVVVDGVGYGTATCKKPAVSWSVTVK